MDDYVSVFHSLLCEYDDSFHQITLKRLSNASAYDSIVISSEMTAYRPKVDGALFCRVKEADKNPYISFKGKYKSWFDQHHIAAYSIKSESDFVRISPSDFLNSVILYPDDLGKLMAAICLDAMSFPKFGCCSRYQDCSAAGKCLHADLLYASACEYRHNLEEGRVFYGK